MQCISLFNDAVYHTIPCGIQPTFTIGHLQHQFTNTTLNYNNTLSSSHYTIHCAWKLKANNPIIHLHIHPIQNIIWNDVTPKNGKDFLILQQTYNMTRPPHGVKDEEQRRADACRRKKETVTLPAEIHITSTILPLISVKFLPLVYTGQ